MSKDYLVLSKVSKRFLDKKSGQIAAVNAVDIEVAKGEFVAIVGPSGCGKTTILRLIAGFENPTSGRIFLDGKDITFLPSNKRGTAMVFQSYALFPHMTIFENVAFGLKLRHVPKTEIVKKVEDALNMVGLSGLSHRWPSNLSGGQQQRVALARSLVINPSVLLCDEPLSNLDANLRLQMRTEIKKIQEKFKITTVYVTHDQDEAMMMADRLILMRSGRIEQSGPPSEIYELPTTRFVAEFMGKANFIPSKISSSAGSKINASVLGKEFEIYPTADFKENQDVNVMIRPEQISLVPLSENFSLKGKIHQKIYHGNRYSYVVGVNNHEIFTDHLGDHQFERGQEIGIKFNVQKFVAFRL